MYLSPSLFPKTVYIGTPGPRARRIFNMLKGDVQSPACSTADAPAFLNTSPDL
jgi:hypothetical protein